MPFLSDPQPRIIIAGAGIGGLSTALALHAAGFSDIHVFEASSTLTTLGVGINVQPSAVLILRNLGLLDALREVGVETQELNFYSRHGHPILSEPRGRHASYKVPQISVHRGEFQMLLLDEVKARIGSDRVHLDHAFSAYEQDASSITARFIRRGAPKGELPAIPSMTAAVLIAADGINSTARRLLYPHEGPPRFSGRMLWRGCVERAPYLTGASMVWAGHANQKFIAYPISGRAARRGASLVNWIAELRVRDENDPDVTPPPTDWTKRVPKERFSGPFSKWECGGLQMAELIESTENVFEFPMCDRDPVDRWTFGRLTLLGDAAHAMYPIGSNGATQAIIDAETLAARLAGTVTTWQQPGVVEAALTAYQDDRLPPTSQIVMANRANGPDHVLQLAHERAPDGFTNVYDVIPKDELESIGAAYKAIAGFEKDAVNNKALETEHLAKRFDTGVVAEITLEGHGGDGMCWKVSPPWQPKAKNHGPSHMGKRSADPSLGPETTPAFSAGGPSSEGFSDLPTVPAHVLFDRPPPRTIYTAVPKMATHDGESFPPRKWYRKVPFLSTAPIKTRLAVRNLHSNSGPSDVGNENGGTTAVGEKLPLPESTASWLSILMFAWLSPAIRTGYTRPLQVDDLYSMPNNRLAEDHADQLEKYWIESLQKNGNRAPSSGFLSWRPFWARRTTDATVLALALNRVCFRWFWLGGLFKLAGDLSQILSPLLIRFLINTLSDPSQHALRAGFGYAVGLFVLLVFSVTSNVHGFYRSYTTGILLRGALMHTIYRRATTQLTEPAKLRHGLGTGKLMSLMSADVTRVDFCCGFFHAAWTSVLQMMLCFALTAWSLGYSALPGFGLLALLYPLQTFMVRRLLRLRRASMPFTDARVKAVVEAVSTIRLVKSNAYERSVLEKIRKLRTDEVVYIRKRMLLRALNTAVSYTAPTLAAVASIVCYGATNENGMEAGVVFSALAFFLLLRTPLQALPTALSAIADARAALERLAVFMRASDAGPAGNVGPYGRDSELDEKAGDDPSADVAVQVEDATFAYHDDAELMAEDADTDAEEPKVPTNESPRLYLDSLVVKKNQLVCIVGPVASGKSSVFRALLGDMQLVQARSCRLNHGNSLSSSQLAFAPQTAWLLSETVRENIVFGRPLDLAWYEEVLTRCCLHPDLERLPEGDMTVVGEMGVSLSGGQKQRISLARVIYGRSPLLFLDDCFSALDAHVGARVFDMVVNRARKNNEATVVLVTHSMVFARQADHLVYMENGRIVEQGSYESLVAGGGPLSLFVGSSSGADSDSDSTRHGSDSEESQRPEADVKDVQKQDDNKDDDQDQGQRIVAPKLEGKREDRGKEIMQKEERLVGSVSGKTYARYVKMGNARLTVPLFLAAIITYQGTSIVSPLWLSWWQDNKYTSISEDAYMGGYAAFGIGQSLGLFCMSATFALFCFWCSNRLHHAAISKVLHAPVAFFDTTPQGRITHRFSKDVDAVDNVVGETLRLFISTAVQVLGTIIVVTIVVPAFVAIAAALLLVYIWTGMYYRPSSRELRRLNNLLRSRIYEHFGESLSGLPTLKAFGAVARFVGDNGRSINAEAAAYWMSVACQRWLNLRLDLCGATLVLATALLVVGLRDTIAPSSGGVVLSYVVTAQAVFGNMIRQSAEIENNMNSVERMLHYAYNIEQEPAHEADGVDKPLKASGWPRAGHVQFEALTLSHRPGLKPALKDVTLDIKPGEKVGVVGRTGAGKTTLISALLRTVEPTNGRILIDGVDIHTVGLHLLRSSLSVISQDAVLLAGTIRYNLDPFQQYDDAWLRQCLRRVGLAGSTPDTDGSSSSGQDKDIGDSSGKEEKNHQDCDPNGGSQSLTLDSEVKEGGANLSHGQRSLISIARALVRRSKILILDEATASIDGRADAELQVMLNEVVGDATVLTVAHRLDTIVATCDKVAVMDNGRVAEFGGVSELYSKPDSLFRALCDASKTTLGGGQNP
ncbi:hypothetical protein CHGG_02253 [Chaetomium globosum CBS 148.51]|uniref:Uncharacterized protein n=1 Tax=Chaetomium globosum (strain ATCC 6205 / CBS 148.51 / DSM 1962 / NBRC 6347 / NRRL 1970) TaxID=306901 RepID=Q2HC01_CHAGB|nr:uncharacterized protein CHGG_02253 [Chaetomium globosum CBS 148.51]EAQ90318.1 hypothetical protein CHGG_02253 [Chaetomium globosum CBS 148.51]